MYVDSSDLNSPVAMETDIPLIEDVQRLKKTVEEGATQVNLTLSLMSLSLTLLASQLLICVSRPELKNALQSLRNNQCVCGMSFLHGAPNCSVFLGYLLMQKAKGFLSGWFLASIACSRVGFWVSAKHLQTIWMTVVTDAT